MTKIEWAEKTWNPITGCTPVSEGCEHCYARRMANRLRGQYGYPADEPFRLTLHPDRLEKPMRWKKPRQIFVCSMSDLFHGGVPNDYIDSVFDVMARCPQHTFQVLTKRPANMAARAYCRGTPPNVWLGTTVELDKYAKHRLIDLACCLDTVRFVSFEPLLGPIDLARPGRRNLLHSLDWVIVGGETGPGARPMNPQWARDIRDQCVKAGVPFFFKGHGGVRKGPDNRLLDGRLWDEKPKARR